MPAGYTQVDIQAIRNKAQEGSNLVKQFQTAVDKMEQAMKSTEQFWEGDAAKLYREVFQIEIKRMREDLAKYAEYPKQLNEYANMYEGVHKQAESIADRIEKAVWVDV